MSGEKGNLPSLADEEFLKIQERADEEKMKGKYPNLPRRAGLQKKLQKGRQKYFDSADYFMAQYKLKKEQSQGLVSEATGDHVLTPQNLPHAKSSTGENKCAQ